MIATGDFQNNLILRRQHEYVEVLCGERLDVEHRANRVRDCIIFENAVSNHLVQDSEGLLRLEGHFAISASISSRSFGTL